MTNAAGPRRTFSVCGRRFTFEFQNIMDACLHMCTVAMEKIVLLLGPMLIIFASVIISGLTWTFFTIVLPMLQHYYLHNPNHMPVTSMSYVRIGCHIAYVLFVLIQIIFNYFQCVTTSNKGPNYDIVVRELAAATNFPFPETPQAVEAFRRDYEDKMLLRIKRRQMRAAKEEEDNKNKKDQAQSTIGGTGGLTATTTTANPATTATTTTAAGTMSGGAIGNGSSSPLLPNTTTTTTPTGATGVVTQRKTVANINNNKKKTPVIAPKKKLPTPKQVRNWMLMAPDEWGYCQRSKQPKPPRAHYDHVTKSLVLCLDHYCPWMFNTIGYFNYRYFCNFLWFVVMAMFYGAYVTYIPFTNCSGPLYTHQKQEFLKTGTWKHLYPMVPIAKERMPISMAFMLCLAVGCAVACLGLFHLYLCLTGQTTIEFHGNWVNKRRAKQLNKKWKNPYDLGYKRNWQQVYGSRQSWFLAWIVPSNREPEFLPLPMNGEEGKRRKYRSDKSAAGVVESTTTAASSAAVGAEIV